MSNSSRKKLMLRLRLSAQRRIQYDTAGQILRYFIILLSSVTGFLLSTLGHGAGYISELKSYTFFYWLNLFFLWYQVTWWTSRGSGGKRNALIVNSCSDTHIFKSYVWGFKLKICCRWLNGKQPFFRGIENFKISMFMIPVPHPRPSRPACRLHAARGAAGFVPLHQHSTAVAAR